jgi:hypothetical protein
MTIELINIKLNLSTGNTASMVTTDFIENHFMFQPHTSSSHGTQSRNFIIELLFCLL